MASTQLDSEEQYFNSLWQGLSKDELAKPVSDVSVCFLHFFIYIFIYFFHTPLFTQQKLFGGIACT